MIRADGILLEMLIFTKWFMIASRATVSGEKNPRGDIVRNNRAAASVPGLTIVRSG
jgi:hypothetical protein